MRGDGIHSKYPRRYARLVANELSVAGLVLWDRLRGPDGTRLRVPGSVGPLARIVDHSVVGMVAATRWFPGPGSVGSCARMVDDSVVGMVAATRWVPGPGSVGTYARFVDHSVVAH